MTSDAPPGRRRGAVLTPLTLAALIAAALVLLPVLAVAASLFGGDAGGWRHIVATRLPVYVENSLWLALFTGTGVAVIGTACAWLVTMCRFPGRAVFEWLLVLPLAAPAYVLAYTYTEFLDHPGPVQTALRAWFELGPRDYWFPEIRSLGGAAALFTLVLYPYVYLLARAAFLRQSAAAFEAARTLGRTPITAFWRVALPMARPAIAMGVALALMETLADYGTVAHFGLPTFTTGIYRAWFAMGDPNSAAKLSACLSVFVLALLAIELTARGSRRFGLARGRAGLLSPFVLRGWRAGLAAMVCAVPVLLGLLVPVGILIAHAATGGHALFGPRYAGLAANSVTLALLAAVCAMGLALLLAYAVRLSPGPLTRGAVTVAGLGYAIPGSIIAVGVLIPLTAFDRGLDSLMERTLGISTGLLLTGTIFALVFAYVVRFLAVALLTVQSGLASVTTGMDDAARVLGAGPGGVLRRVHAPLLKGSLLTAGLIVFVDVMKELPATLMMRPFDFDTLAVQTYWLASDERLSEAATPALTIIAVGLLPVVLLTRQIRRGRAGIVEADPSAALPHPAQ